MSDQNTKRRTFVLIAGILAIGVLGASIATGQLLSARAQVNPAADSVDLECDPTAEICELEIDEAVKSVVSTSGTATVRIDPDKVTMTIGVDTTGLTAEEAASKNAEMMEKVLAALRALGITDDQINTNWYSVYPLYEYRSPPCIEIFPQPPDCVPKSEITGYKASNSVSVTLDADEDVGKVIDAAVAAGANTVSGAYFFVSDERQQVIRDSLIKQAIDNAKSRADKAASAVNMTISGVKSITLNDVFFPVFYKDFAQEASGASTPILPGQQQITMTVQVTYFMS